MYVKYRKTVVNYRCKTKYNKIMIIFKTFKFPLNHKI